MPTVYTCTSAVQSERHLEHQVLSQCIQKQKGQKYCNKNF